jgi:hypothetical protein
MENAAHSTDFVSILCFSELSQMYNTKCQKCNATQNGKNVTYLMYRDIHEVILILVLATFNQGKWLHD